MKDDVSDKTKCFSLLVDEYYYEEALVERQLPFEIFPGYSSDILPFTTSQIIFSFIAIAGGK